jgi:hypothetical protein
MFLQSFFKNTINYSDEPTGPPHSPPSESHFHHSCPCKVVHARSPCQGPPTRSCTSTVDLRQCQSQSYLCRTLLESELPVPGRRVRGCCTSTWQSWIYAYARPRWSQSCLWPWASEIVSLSPRVSGQVLEEDGRKPKASAGREGWANNVTHIKAQKNQYSSLQPKMGQRCGEAAACHPCSTPPACGYASAI